MDIILFICFLYVFMSVTHANPAKAIIFFIEVGSLNSPLSSYYTYAHYRIILIIYYVAFEVCSNKLTVILY